MKVSLLALVFLLSAGPHPLAAEEWRRARIDRLPDAAFAVTPHRNVARRDVARQS